MVFNEWLKQLGLYTLEKRRLQDDLIQVYKILNDKERIDKAKFFKPALDSHGLRGHRQKLFKPRCATTVIRTYFSSRVVNDEQLATTCHLVSLSSCRVPTVMLYTDRLLAEVKAYRFNSKIGSVLSLDKTYNLGQLYVTDCLQEFVFACVRTPEMFPFLWDPCLYMGTPSSIHMLLSWGTCLPGWWCATSARCA